MVKIATHNTGTSHRYKTNKIKIRNDKRKSRYAENPQKKINQKDIKFD